MSRQRLSETRWRELVAQQRASGLEVAAFCQQHGLVVSTFYWWRRRLERPPEQEDQAAPRFIEPRFVELTTAADAGEGPTGGVELVLRRGGGGGGGVAEIVVRVREGFDAALLRRVVEVLS